MSKYLTSNKGEIVKTKIFFLLIFLTVQIFSQSIEIKSLKTYAGDDETSLPIITSGNTGPQYITIEFDVQSDFLPSLNIVFRFCDRNWNPYNNIFLLNQGKNIGYRLDFTRLPSSVTEAKYHYAGSFPDQRGFVEFPFSGKWRFYVTDSQDTSKVYTSGKFYVVYPNVVLQDTVKKEQLEDKIYFPADLSKIFNITTSFNLPDEFYPANVNEIEIIDNHKIDYPIIIDRGFNTNVRQYYWNGDRKFTFTARDILPGNEYRQADLRNTNIFSAKNVKAHLDEVDYSRFFTSGKKDLNGGSIFTNYNDDFATYLNVTFTIRPPSEVPGGIYLVGEFNNWKISSDYQLTNSYGLYSITIPLKRGIYDYQYVIADVVNGVATKADWVTLEGNNWSASNIYNIFLYYKDPNYGGYDRIIGYQQIISE